MEVTCFFCQVDTSRIVHSDSRAIVFRDGYPISPGHTLIIPRRHVSSFFDCADDERASMLNLLDLARRELITEFAPDGFNIGINDGASAGQTVPHVHVHLIPRFQGDVPDPRGGVRHVIPERADYWTKP